MTAIIAALMMIMGLALPANWEEHLKYLDPQDQVQLLEYARVLDERSRSEQSRFFQAWGDQIAIEQFLADHPNLDILIILGGTRSGKTFYTTNLICRTLAGRGPLAQRFGDRPLYCRDIILNFTDGYKTLVDDAKSGYRRIIQRDLLKGNSWVKAKRGSRSTITVDLAGKRKDGTIEIMSAHQDPEAFGGRAIDICRVHEWFRNKQVFDENMDRLLDNNGIMIVEGTMVAGRFHWARKLLKDIEAKRYPRAALFHLDTRNNPFINQARLKRKMRYMSQEEIDRRVRGQMTSLGERLLPDFNTKDNVIRRLNEDGEPKWQIPNEWPKAVALDVHGAKPNALIWGAVEKIRDRIFLHFWKEGWCKGLASKTNDMAKIGCEGLKIEAWFIERSLRKFDHNRGDSELGLFVDPDDAPPWKPWDGNAEGRRLILHELSQRLPVNEIYKSEVTGKIYRSQLIVHSHLEDTIDQFESVSLKPEVDINASYSENRIKDWDDFFDAGGAIAQWAWNKQNLLIEDAELQVTYGGSEYERVPGR